MLLSSLLAACFRKDSHPHNIAARLEQLFPGRFQVVNSNISLLDVLKQLKGEKRAVVGDKNDPDVQFVLDWHTHPETTLGVTSDNITQAHEQAKANAAQARKLIALLKESGLKNFSVSVMGPRAIIQVFSEPSPATRDQTVHLIKSALDHRPQAGPSLFSIEMLEESGFHTKYQDVIPRGQWLINAGWQDEQRILLMNFELTPEFPLQKLLHAWEINPVSTRCQRYQSQSFQEASAWAKHNLPARYHLSQDQLYVKEVRDQHDLSVRFVFPYFLENSASDAAEAAGYISGWYNTDQGTFTQLRKQSEP